MYDASVSSGEQSHPYPTIGALLARKSMVIWIGTLGMLVIVSWVAYRTGVVELYPLALLVAAAIHLVLKVAVELVQLVADTLMPR